jgi:hypothetical protein
VMLENPTGLWRAMQSFLANVWLQR